MQFQFEPNLRHQSDAVNAVVRVFDGHPFTRPEDTLWNGEVSGNVLSLDSTTIRKNVALQAAEHGVMDFAPTDQLEFSVEMETGTGKTYVYLRTIFQLHKRYGFHKFIIVVPSVAVREGVLSTLQDTQQHFQEIFGQTASIIQYQSKRLPDIRNFCLTNHLSIVVMNKQAFDRDSNVINAEDRDDGNVLHQLQAVQPIIIMDEPQEGMDTPNMQKRFASFRPLFMLRYSATHRDPKNLVYRLTPYDAYSLGLVKKIAVLSIHETNTQSNVAIKFRRLNLGTDSPTASLTLNARKKGGDIHECTVTVKRLDDLKKRTNNPVYNGWVVEDIGTTDIFGGDGYIQFTNGERITVGASVGSNKEDIFRQQLRRTVDNHLRRKQQLAPLRIKPLALIFIDRVANYVSPDGMIRRLFVDVYADCHQKAYGEPPVDIDAVHGGYFAQVGRGEYTDNARTMMGEAGRSVYDRILKEKAQLISFDEPMEFIFSHSALGVGWDNPNVFTICTLNESASIIKKRQEIGRGLRLCVQQNGRRYRDPEETPEGKEVNLLTVVPNESYQNFVTMYQHELHEEMGQSAELPEIRDENRKETTIRRVNEQFTSGEFEALWQRIERKTRYRVCFREETLVEDGVRALSSIFVPASEVEVSLHSWREISESGISAELMGANRDTVSGRQTPMNIVRELSRNTALSISTTVNILQKLPERQIGQLASNPVGFIAEATKLLRPIIDRELVRLVKYESTEEVMSATEIFPIMESTKRDVTKTPTRCLYDHIIHDSDVERAMANAFDGSSAVRLFLKLPKFYKIPTPIGNYTPDFALVMEKINLDGCNPESKFYFVVETKGTSNPDMLTANERFKIACAIRHFEALGMKTYLAPVDNLRTFDMKAREVTNTTFFNH